MGCRRAAWSSPIATHSCWPPPLWPHLSRVVGNVGTTFGSVVGIFVGILLGSAYGTALVARQVQRITQTTEDVASMKVEAGPLFVISCCL